MAGVAHASADKNRSKGGIGYNAGCPIAGKPRGSKGIAIHFANFTVSNQVDGFAHKRGQSGNLSEIANSAYKILVTKELIQAVGS